MLMSHKHNIKWKSTLSRCFRKEPTPCSSQEQKPGSLLKRQRPFVVCSWVHPWENTNENALLLWLTARSTPCLSFGHPSLNKANPIEFKAFICTSLLFKGEVTLHLLGNLHFIYPTWKPKRKQRKGEPGMSNLGL